MKLIAGPCVVESKDILKRSVESILKATHAMVDIDFYFKSSFKKDNRTLPTNFQTIGELQAINLLLEIKEEYNVKTCTDFHSIEDIDNYGKEVDVIQIPAFLARQNDLLTRASEFASAHDKTLFIKKPQFMSPEDVWKIFKFTEEENIPVERVFVADRGTQLGYDKVFLDPRHIEIMKSSPSGLDDYTVLADISHPQKNYIKRIPSHVLAWRLGLSSIAAGADGIFLENHCNPSEAFCDRDTQIPTGYDQKIIKDCYQLWRTISDYNE